MEHVSFRLMLNALLNLGLSQTDAELYIFLAAKIPQNASGIAEAMRITKQQVYPHLKNLQEKGIVTSTNDHPRLFSAVPIENVLNMLAKANLEQADSIEQNKQRILTTWQEIIKTNSTQ